MKGNDAKWILSADESSHTHDVNKFSFREDNEFPMGSDPEAFGVSRARDWTVGVENNFRLQQCGWRDVYEYRSVHDEPEVWKHSGFVSKIYQKRTGVYHILVKRQRVS